MNYDDIVNPSLETEKASDNHSHIDIRIQARNGRKSITIVEGLATQLSAEELKEFLKGVKKKFVTNGAIIHDEDHGTILQLQGDHRVKLEEILLTKGFQKGDIKIHG